MPQPETDPPTIPPGQCRLNERGRLTPDERAFHAEWAGFVHIVRSVDEAYKLVGVLP